MTYLLVAIYLILCYSIPLLMLKMWNDEEVR
jgi:hypothetical protein